MINVTTVSDKCHPDQNAHLATLQSYFEKNLKERLMNIIFFLIELSLLVALGFLAAFFWAVRSGQYDDDYTPSVRMLFDDESKTE